MDMRGGDVPVGDVLRTLADPTRRELLRLFYEGEREAIGFEELSHHLARCEDASSVETVDLWLYHVHLPALEEAGLIEYDGRSNGVRCRPNPNVAELLASGLVDRDSVRG